jgi:hypothetical protein
MSKDIKDMRARCENCKFEVKLHCRRNPPIAHHNEAYVGDFVSVWPDVAFDDWCGEWKQKE